MTQLRKGGALGFINEGKKWNRFKKKEETEELCDWVVGFKMRRERENGTSLRKKRKKRKRSYVTVSWVSE